jgi:hypothetical protein
MPHVDVIKFRAAAEGNDPAAEQPGQTIDSVRYRAHGDSDNPSEPLPTADPNSLGSGLVVNDDYKTNIDGYWQFWRMSHEEDIVGSADDYKVWPDLSWRWTKHPYKARESQFGERPDEFNRPTEMYETRNGVFFKHYYQRGFESSGTSINPLPAYSIFGPYIHTSHVKFIWAGSTDLSYLTDEEEPIRSGAFHGLNADRYFANSGPGVYAMGVQGDPWTYEGDGNPRGQNTGTFSITFKYGSYDPGPGDTQTLSMSFTFPIVSVLRPDLARDFQTLDPANGNAGKYTFVMVSDGTNTQVGMIQGHSGGDIEWFGMMTPFPYNRGGNVAGAVNIANAVAKYRPPRSFGTIDYGGFLGSSYANWHGWVTEVAISRVPYDTIVGELGHLEPTVGYLHLDHVKVRANA